jgi:cytochrome c oxidase subunit II
MNWTLPHGTSTFVDKIDPMYYLILWITGIAFVVVEVGLIWFLFAYRARPGRRAEYSHGNMIAEITWTSVTAITVLIIGIMSVSRWNFIKGRQAVPPDALAIKVHAKQFEWQITYPGPDGKLETPDDFQVRSQLHVPVNKPVLVLLDSEDAIHSFFVPSFRIKQDAVPGMNIRVWFQARETGDYELACAELCGLGHYRMRATVKVHAADEYDRWMQNRGQLALQK